MVITRTLERLPVRPRRTVTAVGCRPCCWRVVDSDPGVRRRAVSLVRSAGVPLEVRVHRMGFGPPWWAARLAPGPRRLRSGAWRRIPSPAPAAGSPRTARPTSPKATAPPAKTGRAAVPRPASSTRSCRRERRSWRGGPASSMAIGTAMSARTAPPAITTTATATPGATQSTSASTAPAPSRTTRRSKAPRREPTFCPVNTHGATAVRRRHRSSAHR